MFVSSRLLNVIQAWSLLCQPVSTNPIKAYFHSDSEISTEVRLYTQTRHINEGLNHLQSYELR
jgi:hypothetical protein